MRRRDDLPHYSRGNSQLSPDPSIRDRLRGRLTSDVLSIWDEFETAWGKPIGVDLIREADRSPGAAAGLRLEPEPMIVVLDPDQTGDPSILHELLHFRRYFLDRVPRVYLPVRDASEQTWQEAEQVSRLDNDIEHLLIVPEQVAHGYANLPFWLDGIRKNLTSAPRGRDALRWHGMYALLQAMTLRDQDLMSSARDWIEPYEFLEDAEAFCEEALSRLGDKTALIELVLTVAPVRDSLVRLKQYDRTSARFVTAVR